MPVVVRNDLLFNMVENFTQITTLPNENAHTYLMGSIGATTAKKHAIKRCASF